MATRMRRAFRPLAVAALAAVVSVVALTLGPARAGVPGDWSSLSPAERSELAPIIATYRYITENYAGPFDRRDIVDGALRGMIDALGDPHSTYFNPVESQAFSGSLSGTYEGVGLVITAAPDGTGALVQEVLKGGPAEAAGVRAGDVIIAVDGNPVSGIPVDVVATMLKGASGTRVTVTLHRGAADAAEPARVVIVRGVVDLPSVTARVPESGIAYVRVDQFNGNTGEQFLQILSDLRGDAGGAPGAGPEGLEGLVLDLRGNPGGYVDDAVDVAGALVPSGPVVRIVDADGNESDFPARPTGPIPRIAVLVDGGTASAAEIVSGALQDSGALLFGTRTYGKGSVQSLIPLPNGGLLKLTAAHYYTPKGRPIDHIGLEPDVAIESGASVWDAFTPWGEGSAARVSRGDSGPAVRALQERLLVLGYRVSDGYGFFGQGTLAALDRFERDTGLARQYSTNATLRQALDDAVADWLGDVAPGDAALAAALVYLLTGHAAAGAGTSP